MNVDFEKFVKENSHDIVTEINYDEPDYMYDIISILEYLQENGFENYSVLSLLTKFNSLYYK